METSDWFACWLVSGDAEKNIAQTRRMLRDAQRGKGRYTHDDYVWLVNELSKLLKCRLAELEPGPEEGRGRDTTNHLR